MQLIRPCAAVFPCQGVPRLFPSCNKPHETADLSGGGARLRNNPGSWRAWSLPASRPCLSGGNQPFRYGFIFAVSPGNPGFFAQGLRRARISVKNPALFCWLISRAEPDQTDAPGELRVCPSRGRTCVAACLRLQPLSGGEPAPPPSVAAGRTRCSRVRGEGPGETRRFQRHDRISQS